LSSASMPLHDRIFKHLSRSGRFERRHRKKKSRSSPTKSSPTPGRLSCTPGRSKNLIVNSRPSASRDFPQPRCGKSRKIRPGPPELDRQPGPTPGPKCFPNIADTPLTASHERRRPLAAPNSDTLLRLAPRAETIWFAALFTTSQQAPEASASLSRLITVFAPHGQLEAGWLQTIAAAPPSILTISTIVSSREFGMLCFCASAARPRTCRRVLDSRAKVFLDQTEPNPFLRLSLACPYVCRCGERAAGRRCQVQ